jgi:hypothetical protein
VELNRQPAADTNNEAELPVAVSSLLLRLWLNMPVSV